ERILAKGLVACGGNMHWRLRKPVWLVLVLFAVGILPILGQAREKYGASEFFENEVEENMGASDILSLLDRTVGGTASSGTTPFTYQLRQGVFVTAIPQGPNLILRFTATRSDTAQPETITEVAISAALGRTFFTLVEAALETAEFIFSTRHFASPWALDLHAESQPGGEAIITVTGDETAQFTLAWELSSPRRPIDSFPIPTAFSKSEAAKANMRGTVHFPVSVDDFIQFVNRAYGQNAPERFTDFPLFPHTWLHLTVTAQDATNRVVN